MSHASSDHLVPLIDAAAVAEAAAEIFVATANAAVAESGRFVAVLSGGSTPRGLYELLAEPTYSDRIPWDQTVLLFGDERCVPLDDPQSNYRMVREALLGRVTLRGDQLRPMASQVSNPARAAHFYEAELRGLYPESERPRFDLLLLGVGGDGHTASLFPGTAALDERERWVVANYVPTLESWRITMTLPALCAARLILFLVTGESKARIVAEAFGGAPHDGVHPCEQVVPVDGKREILLDRAAASLLPAD